MKFNMIYDFFGGYYHQDVWDDFDTDGQVWEQFRQDFTLEELKQLITEIEEILKLSNEEILNHISPSTEMGGIGFETGQDARNFLEELKLFIK